ncbi:MAG: chaperone NapD, partial [Mariprofundaceae bacterium]|nr:chaperone NapD [Mariprofundaceae bacterium]
MSMSDNHEYVGCTVGAVLQVKPNMEEDVRLQLKQHEQVEIHAEDAQSRWVITLEADNSKKMLQLTEHIQNMAGVLSVTPVYQHCEDNQNNEQEGGWKW